MFTGKNSEQFCSRGERWYARAFGKKESGSAWRTEAGWNINKKGNKNEKLGGLVNVQEKLGNANCAQNNVGR